MKKTAYYLIIISIMLMLFALLVLPENKYDWMIEMTDDPNFMLPIDDDSIVSVNFFSILIVGLSTFSMFFKSINIKIRIPLALIPCFGVLLKNIA